MSRAARCVGAFGPGKQIFQLNIGELEELQELADAGPEEIFHRISEGRWRLADIRETIRLGLQGGGMEPTKALIMRERYAGPGHLAALKPLATNILAAALVGAPDEDEPLGEKTAGATDPSLAENSGSGGSTKSAAPSGIRRKRSRKAPSGG